MSSSQNYKLRTAEEKDLELLSKLINSAYRGESSKQGWTTEADLISGQRTDVQALAEILADPEAKILMLEEHNPDDETSTGRPIACVYLKRHSTWAYLGMLTVSPNRQELGLGKQMLKAAEAFVQQDWKLPQIKMTVITLRLELIDWYLRRGYRQTGEYAPFPASDPRFGIPQRDDIRFEFLMKILN